ncbi:hypothetical protein ACLMJK_003900 [Lecanora helva]
MLTRQPFKRIFTILTILFLPVRILYILLKYLPAAARPHSQWTYHQAVGNAIFALWWKYTSTVEFLPSKTLDPGSDGSRFLVMDPGPLSIYQGILTRDPAVRPTTIGGMWYPRPYNHSIDAGKKIAIHFHGGAFVLGGCRPMEGGWGPDMLATKLSGFSLMPQYRLARDEHSRFPAAAQDGMTAYRYLLDIGVLPRNIVLSGDSAGANLVIMLVRYLMEGNTGIPLPRAALLWSPWLDLRVSPRLYETHVNANTDYIPSKLMQWAYRMYIPPDMGSDHPYISPVGNEFQTRVPMYLQTGSAEVMFEPHVKFAKAMSNMKGNHIELKIIQNAPHDTFAAGQLLGFIGEAADAVEAAVEFIEEAGQNEQRLKLVEHRARHFHYALFWTNLSTLFTKDSGVRNSTSLIVCAPKLMVAGISIADYLKDLDFFVLLASTGGIIGSRDQSNHASGITYQDARAHYGVARGLKVISLDLGLVVSVSRAAEKRDSLRSIKEIGYSGIREVEMLDHCCDPSLPPSTTTPSKSQIITGLEISKARLETNENVGMDWTRWSHRPLFRCVVQLKAPYTANKSSNQASTNTSRSANAMEDSIDYEVILAENGNSSSSIFKTPTQPNPPKLHASSNYQPTNVPKMPLPLQPRHYLYLLTAAFLTGNIWLNKDPPVVEAARRRRSEEKQQARVDSMVRARLQSSGVLAEVEREVEEEFGRE